MTDSNIIPTASALLTITPKPVRKRRAVPLVDPMRVETDCEYRDRLLCALVDMKADEATEVATLAKHVPFGETVRKPTGGTMYRRIDVERLGLADKVVFVRDQDGTTADAWDPELVVIIGLGQLLDGGSGGEQLLNNLDDMVCPK